MSKISAFLFIALLALSSALVGTAVASDSIPKPSTPEFTVGLASHPYNVTPHNSVDPYTGTITSYPSHVVENKSIEVTIKNQQFNSYQMADGNWSHLYYSLRFKGHFDTGDWTYYPSPPEFGYNINASPSKCTVISLDDRLYGYLMLPGSQIDFQAQALIGYDGAREKVSSNSGQLTSSDNYFTGETSDWSNTQILIIPVSSEPTPSPISRLNQTTESLPNQLSSQGSTPSQSQQSSESTALFGFSWGEIAITVLFSVSAVFLMITLQKKVKDKK